MTSNTDIRITEKELREIYTHLSKEQLIEALIKKTLEYGKLLSENLETPIKLDSPRILVEENYRVFVKNNNVEVVCHECKRHNNITLELTNFDKSPRQLGYEYVYDFDGECVCHECGETLKTTFSFFEYPKYHKNWLDYATEGCIVTQPALAEDIFGIKEKENERI